MGGGERRQVRHTLPSAPHSTTARPLANCISRLTAEEAEDTKVSRFANEKEGGNTRGAIRNHRSIARSLARQVMSHGSPLGRGRLPPSVPHPTTVRSPTRSPTHVSRPATGHMEGTQEGATPNHRSFAHSFANSRLTARHWSHGRGTRGVTLHHRSLARSPIHVSLIAIGKGVTPKRDLWA